MRIYIYWSLLLLAGCQPKDFPAETLIVPATNIITADYETPPVPSRIGKDAADDPAIWYNAAAPEKSAVIGTVKRYGLEVYDLKGQKRHSYKTGNPNNVDVRNGFSLKNGDRIDLAVCSDRSTNEIIVFKINPADASLELLPGGRIKTSLEEVYGICLYKSHPAGDLYVFVNGKDGSVQQYHLFAADQNGIGGKLVRQFKLNSQPEGMVADDRMGKIYLGEEDKGVWTMEASPDLPAKPVFLAESSSENPGIAYDIEGISIYAISDTTGYIVVSSQGNNSYAIFSREAGNKYLTSFIIGDGIVDGTAETDGLDICSQPLGDNYRQGLLVVQDGFNTGIKGKPAPQNFKLIAFEKVIQAIKGN